MGKRKSSKKPVVRRQNEPLSTTFKCLFCHHEKAVTVKLDKQGMFGNLNCKTCGQKFTTPINNLSAAVDVYCDWVDACEEASARAPPKKAKAPKPRSPSPRPVAELEHDDEDEDDVDEDNLEAALNKRKAPRATYDSDEEDNRRSKVARRAYDSDDDDDE